MRLKVYLSTIEIFLGIALGYLTFNAWGSTSSVAGVLSIFAGLLCILLISKRVPLFNLDVQPEAVHNSLHRALNFVNRKLERLQQMRTLQVSREQSTQLWLELLWKTSHRYWATIHTAPNEAADTKLFDLGIAVLGAKARVEQVDVRRLLLAADAAELQQFLPTLEAHQRAQIPVRYLLREQLNQHPLLQSQLKKLPSLDFSLIDSQLIWSLLLNKQRQVCSGELQVNEAKANQQELIFRTLWEIATVPQRLEEPAAPQLKSA